MNRDALALLEPQFKGVIAQYQTKKGSLKHPAYRGIDWMPLLKADTVPTSDIQIWMTKQDYANPVALCFTNTLNAAIARRWLMAGGWFDIGEFDKSRALLCGQNFRVGPIPSKNRSGKIQENREEFPAVTLFYGAPGDDEFAVIPPLGWQSPSGCETEDEVEELDEELADIEVA